MTIRELHDRAGGFTYQDLADLLGLTKNGTTSRATQGSHVRAEEATRLAGAMREKGMRFLDLARDLDKIAENGK